jgi:hypothetical protein
MLPAEPFHEQFADPGGGAGASVSPTKPPPVMNIYTVIQGHAFGAPGRPALAGLVRQAQTARGGMVPLNSRFDNPVIPLQPSCRGRQNRNPSGSVRQAL